MCRAGQVLFRQPHVVAGEKGQATKTVMLIFFIMNLLNEPDGWGAAMQNPPKTRSVLQNIIHSVLFFVIWSIYCLVICFSGQVNMLAGVHFTCHTFRNFIACLETFRLLLVLLVPLRSRCVYGMKNVLSIIVAKSFKINIYVIVHATVRLGALRRASWKDGNYINRTVSRW